MEREMMSREPCEIQAGFDMDFAVAKAIGLTGVANKDIQGAIIERLLKDATCLLAAK